MSERILAPELRLALAMRGGVSLSVWIGGAVRELERFRADVIGGNAQSGTPTGTWPDSALAAVGRAAGYFKVQIDVASGASAGGLNAVILGAAMANGRSLDTLRDVWLDAASLDQLLYESSHTPRNSILRGDYFLAQLRENLEQLLATPAAGPALVVDRLDVFLSVTSVVSNTLSAALDPTAPVTEQRIDGQIHLRKRATLLNEFAPDRAGDLAVAARSTAAFPVAFEPLRIAEDQLQGDIDFRPARPEPLLLFDGGVTDNMPVGKAARAIGSAPADGPTDRLLLYLHPSPGVPDSAAAKQALDARRELAAHGARPFDVLRTTLRSLRSKSLLEDLQAIEAHNERIEQQLTDRDRLLAPLARPADSTAQAANALVDVDAVPAPELDAARLVDLFASPWEHVAEHLPPAEFAPQAGGRNGEQVEHLVRLLTQDLAAVRLPHAADLPTLSRNSLRPWGAVIRTASLLIEWCQSAGDDARVVDAAGQKKLRLYELRDRAVRSAADLNVDTLRAIPELPPADDAAATLLVQQRTPQVTDQLDTVVEHWHELATIAAELAALLSRDEPESASADPATPAAGHELARALQQLLPPTVTVDDAMRALDQVDVVTLPLHRGESQGSLERIRYLTLSGNAGTPLAECFAWPAQLSRPEPRFATIRPLPTGETPTGSLQFDDTRSDASSKLAGNQLHNFSAFLERSWRANDWMWGQMDAAATLVDLVLDPERLSQMSSTWRHDLAASIHDICTAPLRVDGAVHPWSTTIVNAARDLWTDDVAELVRTELDTIEAGSPVPPITRSLVLWRRHVEIAAVEFDLPQDEGPTGKPTPSSLAEGFAQWDTTSRSLSDQWGERRVTALGMRAVFVGWRAIFNRVQAPLSLLRTLLAPILAPIAGFFLCRRRTSVAAAVFVGGCIVPRFAHDLRGRIITGVLLVLFVGAWLWLTRDTWVDPQGRRRRRFDYFTEFWSLVSIVATVAVLVELVFVSWSWFDALLPTPELSDRGVLPYVLPVATVMLVTLVTWYWAELVWRLVVTVVDGAIIALWVWLSTTAPHRFTGVASLVNPFRSYWWAFVALVLATTLIGYNLDVADLPEQADADGDAD